MRYEVIGSGGCSDTVRAMPVSTVLLLVLLVVVASDKLTMPAI